MNLPTSASAALLILLAASPPVPAQAMVMADTVVVTNTGSTNFIGYRLLIAPGGEVSYVTGNGPGHARLSGTLLRRLTRDLAVAAPLSHLPAPVFCMKAMSFGTATTIVVGGERSPDLSCPTKSSAVRALSRDVARITAFLKIRAVPRTQGTELPPQNF